ncbi:MAG: hypothetical protein HOH74_05280 [Gemmatimonadetes bacterium]|nr:hypothetical protein [Gemmatimonadota bacterium]
MDRQQDFQLDVAGYLIVRNVLTAEDIEQHLAGLEAEDDVATAALCEHPTLQVYLQQLCGPNHALSGVTGLLPTTTDPDSLAGGGHEPLDWSLAYQKQGDVRFCQSLVVIWALADVAAGDGGFIIVPASHNSQVEVPASLRSGDDSMGLIVQPTLEAGDLLLCVGATLHGTRVWRGQGPQKLFTCTVVAEEVRRPVAAAVAAAPWMAELTPAQQAVLGVDTQSVTRHHPSIYRRDPDREIDSDEFFFWDLNGYLVLRGVMGGAWIAAASAAIDANADRITTGHKPPDNTARLDGTPLSSLRDLFELPAPHADPFRRMIDHPAVMQRLNWMLGGGFTLGHVRAMCYDPGSCGLFMHGGSEPANSRNHYALQNGRSFCESVNVAWQLVDAGPGDGGFVCIPGSHKARYPVPDELVTLDVELGLVRHIEAQAGDVVLFMGAAQTHGAYPWTGQETRKVALLNYKSANRA